MNADDLDKTIEAILLRNDGRWCTPSGAFLDLLGQFAREEKITEIANACEISFSNYRGAQAYVASGLPAIILNNYKPLTAGVDFSKFLRWAGDYVGKCRSALTQGAASAGGWGTYERSGRG